MVRFCRLSVSTNSSGACPCTEVTNDTLTVVRIVVLYVCELLKFQVLYASSSSSGSCRIFTWGNTNHFGNSLLSCVCVVSRSSSDECLCSSEQSIGLLDVACLGLLRNISLSGGNSGKFVSRYFCVSLIFKGSISGSNSLSPSVLIFGKINSRTEVLQGEVTEDCPLVSFGVVVHDTNLDIIAFSFKSELQSNLTFAVIKVGLSLCHCIYPFNTSHAFCAIARNARNQNLVNASIEVCRVVTSTVETCYAKLVCTNWQTCKVLVEVKCSLIELSFFKIGHTCTTTIC